MAINSYSHTLNNDYSISATTSREPTVATGIDNFVSKIECLNPRSYNLSSESINNFMKTYKGAFELNLQKEEKKRYD